jgi:hypothetical protein
LPKEVWEENKTFVDPACGNGNMLLEVLKRKLALNHNPLQAIQSIYGTDIMLDNVKEARLRMLKAILPYVKKLTIEHTKAVSKNIVCTPLDKYPNGSLDYDFEFSYNFTDLQAEQGLDKIKKEKLLDKVSVLFLILSFMSVEAYAGYEGSYNNYKGSYKSPAKTQSVVKSSVTNTISKELKHTGYTAQATTLKQAEQTYKNDWKNCIQNKREESE